LNAIFISKITTDIVNPYNQNPDINIEIGQLTEHFFSSDSYEVQNLGRMFTRLTEISAFMIIISLPFLTMN